MTVVVVVVVVAIDRYEDYWGLYVTCDDYQSFLNRTISMVIIDKDLWLFTTNIQLIVYPQVIDDESIRNGKPITLLWGYIYSLNDTFQQIQYETNLTQILNAYQGSSIRSAASFGLRKYGKDPYNPKDYLIQLKIAIDMNYAITSVMDLFTIVSAIPGAVIYQLRRSMPRHMNIFSFIENDYEYIKEINEEDYFERKYRIELRFISIENFILSYVYEFLSKENILLRIYDESLKHLVGQMCHDPSIDRITTSNFATDCNVYQTILYPPFDFGFFHDGFLYLVFTARPMIIKIDKTIEDFANKQHRFEILQLDQLFICRPKN